MNNQKAIAEMLDEFHELYGLNLTASVCAAFSEVLADCTPQEISYAAVEHLKACKFAPRPSELLAIVKAARSAKLKAESSESFWQKTRDAEEKKFKGAFFRPEGKSVLDYVDELMARGMTREQAVEEVCR